MKKKDLLLFLSLFLLLTTQGFAQDVTTVRALSEDISENLDLDAIASIFGDAKDLEDFEKKLNDPETQISNLDLNEDGYVDYLRVVETAEKNAHLIAIQSVIGDDIYQDVATVEVEKDEAGKTQVQVVGDVYLYGPNYIIEPVYVHTPFIYSVFWRPYYQPYRSVFYWGYYPTYYSYWRPFPLRTYRRNVHVHINIGHTYRRTRVRHSGYAVVAHSKIRRNDYGVRHPQRSYTARTTTVKRANGDIVKTRTVNKSNGTKKRAVGVNKSNGTKHRVAGVNKADGTKKRATGTKRANGNSYRTAGVNKPDGTKKRAIGTNKADGTKKRAYGVKKPDGSTKVVAARKKPNGSRTIKKTNHKPNKGKNTRSKAGKTSKKRGNKARNGKKKGS